ncbi:hypothetical protein HN51_068301 [Arachis hypogaea]
MVKNWEMQMQIGKSSRTGIGDGSGSSIIEIVVKVVVVVAWLVGKNKCPGKRNWSLLKTTQEQDNLEVLVVKSPKAVPVPVRGDANHLSFSRTQSIVP